MISKLARKQVYGVAIIIGFVVGLVGISHADGSPFNWRDYFPINRSMRMSATTYVDDDGAGTNAGPKIIVQADRGPLVSGTFQIQVRARSEVGLTPYLTQIRFKVGVDSNSNGTIQSSEWTVLETAAASLQPNGDRLAQTNTYTVSAYNDVYRIEHFYSDNTTSFDDVIKPGITAP